MEKLRSYSDWEVDRAQKLSKVDRTLRVSTHVANEPHEGKLYAFLPPENGQKRVIEVTPDFLYGIWRVRQSLIQDLEREGLGDLANDIIK